MFTNSSSFQNFVKKICAMEGNSCKNWRIVTISMINHCCQNVLVSMLECDWWPTISLPNIIANVFVAIDKITVYFDLLPKIHFKLNLQNMWLWCPDHGSQHTRSRVGARLGSSQQQWDRPHKAGLSRYTFLLVEIVYVEFCPILQPSPSLHRMLFHQWL